MSVIIDTVTMATFEVPVAQVPVISAQFTAPEEPFDLHEPPVVGDDQLPKNFGEISSTYWGISKDGNVACVQVYRIDDAWSGICLKTIWN